jgi:hypothetical protein
VGDYRCQVILFVCVSFAFAVHYALNVMSESLFSCSLISRPVGACISVVFQVR